MFKDGLAAVRTAAVHTSQMAVAVGQEKGGVGPTASRCICCVMVGTHVNLYKLQPACVALEHQICAGRRLGAVPVHLPRMTLLSSKLLVKPHLQVTTCSCFTDAAEYRGSCYDAQPCSLFISLSALVSASFDAVMVHMCLCQSFSETGACYYCALRDLDQLRASL